MGKSTCRRKCEGMDIVEAAYCKRVYPFLYCRMEIIGKIEPEQLKEAVRQSSRVVPEILYTFDFQHCEFVDIGLTVNDVVIVEKSGRKIEKQSRSYQKIWDLRQGPQFRIFIREGEQRNILVFAMSHILSDGKGFLQYLYLLTGLYHGREQIYRQNRRWLTDELMDLKIGPRTEQTRNGKRVFVPPLRSMSRGGQLYCISKMIRPENLRGVQKKVRRCGATLNDVFLTAYTRVLARITDLDKIVLPCPADLRSILPVTDNFTVANMTGVYRRVTVEITHGQRFEDTLSLVHLEMEMQKSRNRCLSGIKLLYRAEKLIPVKALKKVIRVVYPLPFVSYTNFGVIDEKRLSFQGCKIRNCFLTGSYRLPPDFQISFSTYEENCTLNCTLIGNETDQRISEEVLEQVRNEIVGWGSNI